MQNPTETRLPQHFKLPPTLHVGLALLVRAREYADDVGHDPWDFAVEIQTLRAAELTSSDFRWLVCRGYLEHAREMTGPSDSRREFRRGAGLTFTKRTCFVLTEAGLEFARSVCRLPAAQRAKLPAPREEAGCTPAGPSGLPLHVNKQKRDRRRANGRAHENGSAAQPANGSAARHASKAPREEASCIATCHSGLPLHGKKQNDSRPEWDSERHEFRLGGRIVKTFKVPSPNQETILTAFEEDGWPRRIDDPLPPAHSMDPKQRLHDTIKSLNRNQKLRLIRFQGDGSGQGICWESLSEKKRRS